MNKKNAFVIIHFGDNAKYLELEIYLSIQLKNNSKTADIIYMYSTSDTPQFFIDTMTKYCTHVRPYNDNGITYNPIGDFKSYYTHFNTLRTCNFMFAYKLVEYEKICIIESDTIITKNVDDIFDLNTPSITYHGLKLLSPFENYKAIIDIPQSLKECEKISQVNGGVLLIKPSLYRYYLLRKNINTIIKNNCIYPNETLFLSVNRIIYNMPFKYNAIQYNLEEYAKKYGVNMRTYPAIIHINANTFKHIDIIRDNYLEKIKAKKPTLYYFIKQFKERYYEKNVDLK